MSNNYIITIGREYGSGGLEIGQKLAEKLGIKCYDKELINLVAEKKVSKKKSLKKQMKKEGVLLLNHPEAFSQANLQKLFRLLEPLAKPSMTKYF